MCLTVLFDGQFWIGILEEECATGLRVHRHVFGAEPPDREVLAFVRSLDPGVFVQAEPGAPAELPKTRLNPKRLAREAARATAARGVSTKSQDALRRQMENQAAASRAESREERDAEQHRRREIARQKALKRHRGH